MEILFLRVNVPHYAHKRAERACSAEILSYAMVLYSWGVKEKTKISSKILTRCCARFGLVLIKYFCHALQSIKLYKKQETLPKRNIKVVI